MGPLYDYVEDGRSPYPPASDRPVVAGPVEVPVAGPVEVRQNTSQPTTSSSTQQPEAGMLASRHAPAIDRQVRPLGARTVIVESVPKILGTALSLLGFSNVSLRLSVISKLVMDLLRAVLNLVLRHLTTMTHLEFFRQVPHLLLGFSTNPHQAKGLESQYRHRREISMLERPSPRYMLGAPSRD